MKPKLKLKTYPLKNFTDQHWKTRPSRFIEKDLPPAVQTDLADLANVLKKGSEKERLLASWLSSAWCGGSCI